MNVLLRFLISGALMLFLMPFYRKWLQKKQWGQNIREDGPQSHQQKQGIPTMGGLLFIPCFLIGVFLIEFKVTAFSIATILALVFFTLIGFIDDYLSTVRGKSLGLKGREKTILITIFAGIIGTYIYFFYPVAQKLLIPFSTISLDLGLLIIPFTIVFYNACANAVNLTDGLDGLAGGLAMIALGGLMGLSLLIGNQEGLALGASAVGITLGFLWYNANPATIFMGDAGSLGLGALLATLALFQGLALYLLITGLMFVIITLSVILQVAYFKLTKGKRIFKMSPLHHHFELVGWPEGKIVLRFYILGIIFAVLGIGGAL